MPSLFCIELIFVVVPFIMAEEIVFFGLVNIETIPITIETIINIENIINLLFSLFSLISSFLRLFVYSLVSSCVLFSCSWLFCSYMFPP